MLAAARLRHVAGTEWADRAYLDLRLLRDHDRERETMAVGWSRPWPDGGGGLTVMEGVVGTSPAADQYLASPPPKANVRNLTDTTIAIGRF